MFGANIFLAIRAYNSHIGVVNEAPQYTFNIEADPLRELRYRWTVCEGSQVHLRSPQSYATRREATEDATKAMANFAARQRNRG